MLDKIKEELEINEYLLNEEIAGRDKALEKLKNEGNVGTIKNLLNEIEDYKTNIEKYRYTIGVLKRLCK